MRSQEYYFNRFGEGASPEEAAAANAAAGDPGTPDATWSPNWDQPYSGSTVNVLGSQVPYYIADPSKVDINPDGTPYYLAAPGFQLPSWVIPAAIGVGAFLLIGGGALIFGKRRKRRK